jgi:hypothetical protein
VLVLLCRHSLLQYHVQCRIFLVLVVLPLLLHHWEGADLSDIPLLLSWLRFNSPICTPNRRHVIPPTLRTASASVFSSSVSISSWLSTKDFSFFFFFLRIIFSHCAYRTAPVGVQVLWPCAVTIHSMCLQRNPLTVLLFAFTLSLSLSNKQPGFVSLSQRDSNVSLRGGHSPTPNPQPEQPGYPF